MPEMKTTQKIDYIWSILLFPYDQRLPRYRTLKKRQKRPKTAFLSVFLPYDVLNK